MFEIIFILLFIYIFFLKGISGTVSSPSTLINKALIRQQFSNIRIISHINSIVMLSADSHGENYLIAYKINKLSFSPLEIDSIYDKATKLHIHKTVIIVPQMPTSNTTVYSKISSYNFEIWDYKKLTSLANNSNGSTYTKSVLRTSNTSYDHCKIDNNPVDPIQPGRSHSLLGNLFNRPNRL